MAGDDPRSAAAFYDAYGEREWTRFEDGRSGFVSLETHRHYLARLGARVVVADVSPVQLELNERKVREARAEAAVEERVLADVTDLGRFGDAGSHLIAVVRRT